MNVKCLKLLLPACFLLLFLNGCLTAFQPFYLSDQIIEDHRLLGIYRDKNAGHVWEIKRDDERRKSYMATLSQGNVWQTYQLTLFKFKERIYLDIFPYSDSSQVRDAGGPPTMSEIMRFATFKPLHLLTEIELADDQLTLKAVSREGVGHFRRVSGVALLNEQGLVPLAKSTKELQDILGTISGNDKVFDSKSTMKKDPSTMSRPIKSKCPACGYSFVMMSTDAKDRGETWRVRCPSCGYEYDQMKNDPAPEAGKTGAILQPLSIAPRGSSGGTR
jgi:predicted RNA-binding Zn-ribbon protein involved in translation (DUF1610 family)